jgi:acyl-coenzyme A thioesterase PaaI-like protein
MSQNAILEAVLTFIKGASMRVGSKPGFAHALKVSHNTIAKKRLTLRGPSNKELVYRYKFSNDVPTPSVGLFTALMDELSTHVVFAFGMPAAPGVSLQMQTHIFVHDLPTSEIDLVNKVTKFGRKITHTQTDFVCTETGKLLGQGSHIKYLPTGSWILDFFFNNKSAFKIGTKLLFMSKQDAPVYPEKSLVKEVIRDHLEFQGGIAGRATFHVTPEHTNPLGSMHGGCHAMVMEEVAMVFAKVELKADMLILESIQVEYFKEAKGTVEIVCDTLGLCEQDYLYVRVRIQRPDGGMCLSEGKLRFSTHATKSKL